MENTDDETDLERCGDDLSRVVKVEHRDLCEVGRSCVWDRPTSSKRVQQRVNCVQLLRCEKNNKSMQHKTN